jgi:hypothetical protein
MLVKPYIEKASVRAYAPDNQNANNEQIVEASQNAYQHLRMEKLVAEVLLDFNWQPEPPPPASVAHNTMQYIRGGRFPQEEIVHCDDALNTQWIVLHGSSDQQKEKSVKSLTKVLLVFAVIYLVLTLALLVL